MALPESRQLDFDEIPVIDIGGLLDAVAGTPVVQAIDRACRDSSSRNPSSSLGRLAVTIVTATAGRFLQAAISIEKGKVPTRQEINHEPQRS